MDSLWLTDQLSALRRRQYFGNSYLSDQPNLLITVPFSNGYSHWNRSRHFESRIVEESNSVHDVPPFSDGYSHWNRSRHFESRRESNSVHDVQPFSDGYSHWNRSRHFESRIAEIVEESRILFTMSCRSAMDTAIGIGVDILRVE
ncbi:hypothetical protein QYM36_002429 [Artemia franciscana]|uniref:Uncharacterized protein n=1 Tax=Artemia franciscana TaxID=6661 RepID=A0AA88LHC2_ARTSF|nr:hypothetical protein QYM36_002429 [Artemia franciscana]